MIPTALVQLDQQLRELQALVHSGGEATSRLTLHETATGQRVTTRAEERRLIEDGVLPMRNARGGFEQNPHTSNDLSEIAQFYKSDSDYPNLLRLDPQSQKYNEIAAFAGVMVNRRLKNGERIYRFFGPQTITHRVSVDEARAGGAWWGLGSPPRSAKEWREQAAVLDSFNGDGFFVTATVTGNNGPKAVVGTISEQFGDKIPGQYLPGGSTQAYFFLDRTFADELIKAGQAFINGGTVNSLRDSTTGITFTLHKTGWNDSNGIWGYIRGPGTTTVQSARLGSREEASKQNEQVTIQP